MSEARATITLVSESFFSRVSNTVFLPSGPKVPLSLPAPDCECCIFGLARQKIVYYAPREEKTGTVHISCKLPPEPKTRVANTRCGLANFTPVERILFFCLVGRKYHFRSRRPIANLVFSASLDKKIVYSKKSYTNHGSK